MDMSSLYTNIPNHEGILSVTETLRPKQNGRVSLHSIQKLLTAVLHMNNFKFNKKTLPPNWSYSNGDKASPILCKHLHGQIGEKTPQESSLFRVQTSDLAQIHRWYLHHLGARGWKTIHQIGKWIPSHHQIHSRILKRICQLPRHHSQNT